MTTVELQGRLGNVLFGYAAGLTVQRARGGRLRLLQWRTPSRVEAIDLLDAHEIADVLVGVRHFQRRHLLQKIVWRVLRRARRAARYLRQCLGWLRVVEFPSAFAPAPDDLSDRVDRHVLLVGYFQHPTWFEPSLDVVTERIWSSVAPSAGHLVDLNATLIAVRLGDYVRLGWDLGVSYYEAALDAIGEITGPIWITSDDADAAQELLAPSLRRRGLEVTPLPDLGVSPTMRDIAVTCAARTIIMSNSTFCWWGTVSGQLQGNQAPKTVVCPAPWLPTYPDANVLIRPDWITVDAAFPR